MPLSILKRIPEFKIHTSRIWIYIDLYLDLDNFEKNTLFEESGQISTFHTGFAGMWKSLWNLEKSIYDENKCYNPSYILDKNMTKIIEIKIKNILIYRHLNLR